ncbi:MAG: hypothetical protein WCA95_15710 [Opitutaceae bacterium]|jgi:hypothetical protein
MSPEKIPPALQRTIASIVARLEETQEDDIAATVNSNVGEIQPSEVKVTLAKFRALKAKVSKDLPRMCWGASGILDDLKVARFAFDAAQQDSALDELAVRALPQEAWGNLNR